MVFDKINNDQLAARDQLTFQKNIKNIIIVKPPPRRTPLIIIN